MTKELPSPEMLRKLLRYEPETGKLFWLPRPLEMFATSRAANVWNIRYSEKEAFTSISDSGYKHGSIFNKSINAHRVAWALNYGKWPTHQIDHLNGDRADNRIKNLRDVSPSINQRNQKMRSNNTSGFCGVAWIRGKNRYLAYINTDGVRRNLGYFDDMNEAIEARKDAEIGLYFTERHGL